MTDSLKNNPVALRHCLLYEYLQRNTYSRAFSNFIETFGKDVYKIEELKALFKQFRARKMEGYDRPITDLKNVLRNDKYALRACILYESLKYKVAERGFSTRRLWPRSFMELDEIRRNPSFSLYNNFCKKLGDNVMEYLEFDFWFYRFLNGEFDLNYERDTDKKIYELTDMPIDILEKVVKSIDFVDGLSLSKTSRSLQSFIAHQKLFHNAIYFYIQEFRAGFRFNEQYSHFVYPKNENGFVNNSEKRVKLIPGVPYWKQALRDFQNILSFSKLHLENLTMEFTVETDEIFNEFEFHVEKTLHVKHFSLKANDLEPVLKLLPCFQPGYLTCIELRVKETKDSLILELVEMEQYKKATYFSLNANWNESNGGFVGVPIHRLFHFQRFDVRYRQLSVEDVREMKEILFKSPDFEQCALRWSVTPDSSSIGKEFGDPHPEIPNLYYYPIPDSNEYFEIEVEDWRIDVIRKKIDNSS